eukprot:13668-Heterococcus_DN1.PRE.4
MSSLSADSTHNNQQQDRTQGFCNGLLENPRLKTVLCVGCASDQLVAVSDIASQQGCSTVGATALLPKPQPEA